MVIKAKLPATNVKKQVESAIQRMIGSRNIDVSVENNKITLSGTIHSLAESEKILSAAYHAPGVIEVVNNLYLISDVGPQRALNNG